MKKYFRKLPGVKYKMFFAVLFLAVMAVFTIPGNASAAPAISGVSGTTSQGNTITISGTNFGTKSPAKPLIWAPFEGGVLEADPSLSSGSLVTGAVPKYTIKTDSLPHSRSNYAVADQSKTSSVYKTANDLGYSHTGSGSWYVFARRKYAPGAFCSMSNAKQLFAYTNTVADEITFTVYHDFSSTPNCGYANAGFETSSYYSVPNTAGSKWKPINDGSWVTWEAGETKGDIDTANGKFFFYENSIRKVNVTNWINRTSTHPKADFKRVVFSNFWTESIAGKGWLTDSWDYIDDVYMDSTWSRVMIGNASTFDASTHREPLIPTAWSGNSITAHFNQGSFSNGQQAYVFVVDSDGNASPGRAITINGTPPPTCTSFTYSAWGTCQSSGTQTRAIASSSPSGCDGGNPVTTQSCAYTSTSCTSFTYSAWGACQSNNTQTRTVVSSTPDSCAGGNPVLSQSCTYLPSDQSETLLLGNNPSDQSETLLLGNNNQETGLLNANTNQTYLRLMEASATGQAQEAHISYNNSNSAGCKVLLYDSFKNLLEAVLVPRAGTGWSFAPMAGTTDIASGTQYYIGVVCPGYQEIDSSSSSLLKTVIASSGSSYASLLNPLAGEYNLTGGNLSVYLTGSVSTPGPAQFCGDQSCSNGETCSTCASDCGACPVTPPPTKTYTPSDFTNLVVDWLKSISGSPADVNLDNKVNSKDLGIMMSSWAL